MLTKLPGRTITQKVTMNDRIDELLELIEVEPDALREAEFMQAQSILETLVGKTVSAYGYVSTVEKNEIRAERITIDGKTYELR